MLYTYKLKKDIIFDEEKREYEVYGISVTGENGELIASVADIFFDVERASKFVERCNKYGLSPIHLAEVAEDALIEQYG